jgi:hypothetical protein
MHTHDASLYLHDAHDDVVLIVNHVYELWGRDISLLPTACVETREAGARRMGGSSARMASLAVAVSAHGVGGAARSVAR